MLTLEQLKELPPGSILGTGIVTDDDQGVNMRGTGTKLRWVAKRGRIHDWAIYICHAIHSITWVCDHGDKIHSASDIQKLVACDDEAFKMYRH